MPSADYSKSRTITLALLVMSAEGHRMRVGADGLSRCFVSCAYFRPYLLMLTSKDKLKLEAFRPVSSTWLLINADGCPVQFRFKKPL